MAEDSSRSSYLKNWSARLNGNYSLLAMVPQFPPFIYVQDNRVVSKIGNGRRRKRLLIQSIWLWLKAEPFNSSDQF